MNASRGGRPGGRALAVGLAAALALATGPMARAQSGNMTVPATVTAGAELSIQTGGNGKASLYIVGLGQALHQDVQMGQPTSVPAGVLYNAGHYLAILVGESSTDTVEFDVTPATQPESLGFLAKPSRLPVGLHNGISGAVYVFDAYHNLITTPLPVSLELSVASATPQVRTVTTRNGLAWTAMDSEPKEGSAKLVAKVGGASSTRIIQEVPGDPCAISISAHPNAGKLEVQTAPVKDCTGNAIPDGTIVTFTESYQDTQSTVDVPLKQGVAKVDMPAIRGAKISVACGVVAGNDIRWDGGQ